MVLPNGVTTTLAYDPAGNLITMTHAALTGTVGSYIYQYDDTGRRVGTIESGSIFTYTYDALYRLVQAQESGGNLYQYEYDAAGNRLLKVEPGETVTATYDAANQLLTLGGVPVQHDANGNLIQDGVFTYTYNSLDQLIAVSNGITNTLYGYNGDGDRLWQNTEGVTTTYTLNLNSALGQVLAQTQDGVTTSFLPGIGQEVNDTWTYFHGDALGSIRHLTGPAGQLLGDIQYSPFGEIEDSTGLAPAFGFTGEQQESTSGLVYLRARVYNPALGRFLTPDAIIPDIANGQALNPYTYVYNDPVNFTDPSGNIRIPGRLLSGIPDSLKPALLRGTEIGLEMLAGYFDEPSGCFCEGKSSSLIGSLALGPQAAWAYLSEPAERYGVKVTEYLVNRSVPQWWRKLPVIRSIPGKWGYKTIQVWQESHRAYGTLNVLQKPGMPRGNGTHYTASNSRYTLQTRFQPKWGVKGIGGTVALAGIIDGVFQFASDAANLCFSWAQRLNRAGAAALFGMGAGLIGAVAFGFAVALTAPAWAAIGAGFIFGTLAGLALLPYKEQVFANNPKFFGR